MLAVETLATQTLATSARETPFATRFVQVQQAAVFDLVWLVELEPYLSPADVYVPPPPRFTMTGSGGGFASGIGSYSHEEPPPPQAHAYDGVGGAVASGSGASLFIAAAPASLPAVTGLWAHYDADRWAGALSTTSTGAVTGWADSSGVTGGAPDIGLSLDFSALTPDLDLTFARASTKVVYRAGPRIVLTTSGIQALTTTENGATNLGLLVEGARQQILENSKLAGGGTTPTGWVAIASGTRTPVTSLLTNADGAVAYHMIASAQRPFLSRYLTFADNTTYTMSMVVEAGSCGTNIMLLIGTLGTGGTGDISFDGSNIPATLPAVVSMTFTTGTGNTLSNARFGIGVNSNAGGDLTISRPMIVAAAGPTSFIPSDNGSTPTQAADVGTVALTASNWNDSANTFVLKGRTGAFSSANPHEVFIQADNTNYTNCYRLFRDNTRHLHWVVRAASASSVDFDFGVVNDNTDFTVRIANAANNVRASLNGGTVVQDTSATLPTGVSRLRVGIDSVNELPWNGTINLIEIWKSAKTDAELRTGVIAQGAAGGGPVLSQSIAARRPTIVAYGQNGRDIVQFTSAASTYLASGVTTSFDAFWDGGAYALVAGRFDTLGGQSQGRLIVRNAGLGGWYIGLQAGAVSGACIVLVVGRATQTAIYASGDFQLGTFLRFIEVSFDSANPGTAPVIAIDGATSTVRTIQAGSGAYTETANSPLGFSDPNFAFDGQLADVLFYGSVPSSGDQTSLRDWLTTKWNPASEPPVPPPTSDPIRDNNDQAITDELGGAII